MKIKIFLLIFISIISFKSFSQISQGGRPLSYDTIYQTTFNKQKKVKAITNNGEFEILGINKATEQEKVKELYRECESCRKKYYGKEVSTNINFFEKAQKMNTVNGDELWLLNIKSADAEGYQFLFDNFYLPENCKLYFYNEEKNMTLGAFTSLNNREDNQFVTQYINGNSVYMELYIPAATNKEQIKLSLNKMVFIFDDVFRKGPYSQDGAESCNINTACTDGIGWETETKSVALILGSQSDLWGMCSGALINKENNYSDSDRPFLLTANHCYESVDENGKKIITSNPANWVFIFRHEAQSCFADGSELSKNSTKSVIGADIVSRKDMEAGSDYLLLKLKNNVASIVNYNIAFAGFNANNPDYSTDVVGIHHPAGDVKKISKSYTSPISSTLYQGTCDDPHYTGQNFMKIIWTHGVTAPGSSGSPLFNNSHQLIGTLTGGFSWCENKPLEKCPDINGPNGPDFYGKLSKSWSDGNLSQYLAPASGTKSLSAYVPTLADLSVSVKFVSVGVTQDNLVFAGRDFQIKANSTNSDGTTYWNLWINKIANDFNDYKSDSPNCDFHTKNSIDGAFVSQSFNKTEGNYKGKLWVYNASGRQSTINFTIIVAVRKDPCIYTNFLDTDCSRQLEFPVGANIRLYDYCSVIDNPIPSSWGEDGCHKRYLKGSTSIYPKYMGISRLKWFCNGSQVGSDINFNTIRSYQDPQGYSNYYNPSYSSQCFTLSTEGDYKIRLDAYGGEMLTDITGYSFVNPLKFVDSNSSAEKIIKVVDCNKIVSITTKSELNNNNGGYITIAPSSSISINSGESYNFTAYNSIIIKPGTQIKSGSYFSAKLKKCPEYNCNCTKSNAPSNASSSIINEEIPEVTEKKSEVTVYPNPVTSFLNIVIQTEKFNYATLEIVNSIGSVVKTCKLSNSISQINISNMTSGFYALRIYNNGKLFIRKITKK